MATTTYNREVTRGFGPTRSTGIMGRMRSYLARSRAERQLAQLDDRLLADIGLKRGEITRAVWGN